MQLSGGSGSFRDGLVQVELHRYPLDAFRARQAADYEAPAEVSREDALTQVERAIKFLAVAEELLRGGGPPSGRVP